jgi:hypothetical protein
MKQSNFSFWNCPKFFFLNFEMCSILFPWLFWLWDAKQEEKKLCVKKI